MDQLERVTNLLALLLSTRRYITFDEIRGELRGQYPDNLVAARASFERDKAILRDEAIPIDSEVQGGDRAGVTGYRISRSAYELGNLNLEADETAALRVAVATIRMGHSWAEEALWKVDMDISDSRSLALPASATLPVDQRVPLLHQAISQRHVVEFDYRDRHREVEPLGLLARSGWWYLVGYDRAVGQERTFRVDRIEGEVVIVHTMTFAVSATFDVRKVFSSDRKKLPDDLDVGGDEALVQINASDVGVVLGQYGDEALVERRTDGSAIFRVPCSNVQAFCQWLFGFVDRAEVLQPELLRQYVIDWLEAMCTAGPQ